MLQPIMHQLKTKRIILASSSPRRQQLLRNIGLNAEIIPSTFQENLDPSDFSGFKDYVEQTALMKVLEVSDRLSCSSPPPDLIIGADTMVTMDHKVFGKPHSAEKAIEMLTELIGKKHTVYTAVVLKFGEQITKFTSTADVYFGKATPAQIKAYVDTGEPLDKAGGYGIQGIGGTMIEKIEGDYFTVIGLPLYRLSAEICKLFDYDIK